MFGCVFAFSQLQDPLTSAEKLAMDSHIAQNGKAWPTHGAHKEQTSQNQSAIMLL